MHRLLTILLGFTLAVPCRADDAKPNTLTPKRCAEGWIQLFDGETTFGWKIKGKAQVSKGCLILGGGKDAKEETTAVVTTSFGYGNLQFQAFTDDAQDAQLTYNGYEGRFIHAAPPEEKGWHEFFAQVVLNDLSIWSAGSKGFGVRGTFDRTTTIAFHVPAGQKLLLRQIAFWPRQPTINSVGPLDPLFNGKDLTGWKEFPGRKSQFSVTKEGWLSIKNGPGDLQTKEQWADFVLQLECRTNGDNLNSGVFFRCLPGQYQQGYEAQIQNQHAKQPKNYTIELYDPDSHKLKDKKKIENWSQDYGTGAIYRRVPGRRAVAKDREWFTMTIVARDRHIATWVNGIQVVDWHDNRPNDKNARNGCRLEKGCISLQGHDPTTDLTFRNIRIADLAVR
jgi:hypothetical protein